MKTMGKVLLGCGVFVVLFLVAVGAVFLLTGGLTDIADEFFTAASEGDMESAYALVSADFKANTSQEQLAQFLSQNGFDGFADSSWASRSMTGSRGEITGSITTTSGGTIPVTVRFVKGEDGWKIYAVEKPSAGLQTEGETQPTTTALPDAARQVALVDETTEAFAKAITAQDMTAFRDHAAAAWQSQWTVEKFEETFSSIYPAGDALEGWVTGALPVIESATGPDENGVVQLKGHYPADPQAQAPQVNVETDYLLENGGWKLVGFNIQF